MEIVPATVDRFDDVVTVLGGEQGGCLCQYWRMSSGDYSRSTQEHRLESLREQLRETPPGGMLAYVDGEPAGWLGFAPRDRVGRLGRSRTIPKVDDLPVWSIFCFTVSVGYRRSGVARALLEGLIEYAREQGAPALEAYPVETEGCADPRFRRLRRGWRACSRPWASLECWRRRPGATTGRVG